MIGGELRYQLQQHRQKGRRPLSKAHYEAWLSAWYAKQISEIPRQNPDMRDNRQFAPEQAPTAVQMF